MSTSIARLPSARSRRTSASGRARNRAAFFFLLPGCALFALCVIYPIFSSIALSFYNWDGMTAKTFIGLANYVELFQADTFYVALKNNLIWLVFFLLAPPLGLLFALYLNQQVKGMRVVKSLFFAPFVLSGVVVGLVFSWFYDPTFGLLKVIVGQGRFWVMEQEAGPVNWAPWNPVPAPGMVRLWAYEAFAHGAELVSYFRWRQAPFAQEQMHSGLNLPDNTLSPGGREVARAAREIAQSAALSSLAQSGPAPRVQVALVFDYETQWMFEIQRHAKGFDYQTLAFEYYRTLREMALDVDIVSAQADLSGYELIVVPGLAALPAGFAKTVEQSLAQWVIGPRTGSKTADFAIPAQLPPGALQTALPFKVLEVDSLRPTLQPSATLDGVTGIALHWREHLETRDGIDVLARFDDNWPAVVARGHVRYASAWFDAPLHRALLEGAARDAGLAVTPLTEGLRVRRRGDVTFAFNFGAQSVDAPAPDNAQFVLGQRTLGTADVCAWIDA